MNTCPVCHFSYDPHATGGPCPRCSLDSALAGATAAEPDDNYEFIAELGRGGMGTVSLVRQRSLDRLVALKVIAGPIPADAEPHLLREARAAAGIQHPHVVAVYEVGRGPAGTYIAMEYCEGGDLRARLRSGPLAPKETAALGIKLAGAVACAHAAGVLHRDLKPSNVLLTATGEPKLADFGLSSSMAGATGELTRTGSLAGSPSYLAPELITGGKPTAAVDIYGLGTILYECVAGRPPFTGETPAAIFAQIGALEPVSPRRLNPAVPVDLDTIIRKCLEIQPSRRYPNAEALHADLENFLAGRPIRARPVSWFGRTLRWVRRYPALASALMIIVIGAIASGLLLAERNRRLSRALAQSEQASTESRRALRDSLIAQARTIRESGRQGQRYKSLALLQRAAQLQPPDATLATEALAALALDDWHWIQRVKVPQLRSHHLIGLDAEFTRALVPAESGEEVLVLRLADQAIERRLNAAGLGAFREARFGPGNWIAVEFEDNIQAVWGPDDITPRWQHRPTTGRSSNGLTIAAHAKGWWFITTGNQVMWHDAATNRDEPVGATGTRIFGLNPSPDGSLLAIVRNNRLEVWHLAEHRLLWSIPGDVGIAIPQWTPNGQYVIAERFAGSPEIVMCTAQTGEIVISLRSGNKRSFSFAVHPDGRRLLSVDSDSVFRIWDLVAGRELARGQAGPHSLQISADGRRVAVAASFQTLGVIELAPLDVLQPLTMRPSTFGLWRDADISPDGRWLIGITDNMIRAIDLRTAQEAKPHELDLSYTTALKFLTDGRLLYSSPSLGIRSVRLTDGQEGSIWSDDREITSPRTYCLDTADPRGRWWIVSTQKNDKIALWPEGDRHRSRSIEPAGAWSNSQISADGRLAVFTSSRASQALLYSIPGGELQRKIPVPGAALGRFSPDGRWLMLGTEQGYEVWDTRDLAQVAQHLDFPQPGAIYGYSAFSPDGRRLAYMTGMSAVAISRPEHWLPELTFTLPYGTQRDEWVWSPDGGTLHILSGRNEAYALRPAAAITALRRLGLNPPEKN